MIMSELERIVPLSKTAVLAILGRRRFQLNEPKLMPDENAPLRNSPEVKDSGLEAGAATLQKLCKVLGTAIKSRAFGKPEFGREIQEASKLAGQVDWVALKSAIESEAKACRE